MMFVNPFPKRDSLLHHVRRLCEMSIGSQHLTQEEVNICRPGQVADLFVEFDGLL